MHEFFQYHYVNGKAINFILQFAYDSSQPLGVYLSRSGTRK